MKISISDGIEILVFTGPESSGKTTCAKRIAKRFQLPLVVEYARAYLSVHGPNYNLEDIQSIAEEQTRLECATHSKNPLIICDTDIITSEIWALEKFETSLGKTDELLEKKHYLLCYPDIPWKSDPQRENPEDRKRLFDRYESYLSAINASYSILFENDRAELSLEF